MTGDALVDFVFCFLVFPISYPGTLDGWRLGSGSCLRLERDMEMSDLWWLEVAGGGGVWGVTTYY